MISGQGPSVLDPGFSMVPALAKPVFDRDTGYGPAMAPQRMENLLALALQTWRTIRAKVDSARGEGAH
jgi:hypothetical protein